MDIKFFMIIQTSSTVKVQLRTDCVKTLRAADAAKGEKTKEEDATIRTTMVTPRWHSWYLKMSKKCICFLKSVNLSFALNFQICYTFFKAQWPR